jgi:RecA-family ATPase
MAGLLPDWDQEQLGEHLAAKLTLLPLSGKSVSVWREGFVTETVQNQLCQLASGRRLLIVDPLSRFHRGDENDAGAMTSLVQAFEQVAQRSGAAVLLAHHSNKVAVLNDQADLAQAIRGSSALTDGVRWQGNLSTLSAKMAQDAAISAAERSFYVRFSIPKNNYAPPYSPALLKRNAEGVLTRHHSSRNSASTGARKPRSAPGHEVEYL